jgi:hypothetical protein
MRRVFGEGRRLGFARPGLAGPDRGRRSGAGDIGRGCHGEHPAERAQQPAGLRGGGAEGGDLRVIDQKLDARGVLRQRLVQADQPGMTPRRAAVAPGLCRMDLRRQAFGPVAARTRVEAALLPT